jgi:c-di-AMP phosphodiesterase-like protein
MRKLRWRGSPGDRAHGVSKQQPEQNPARSRRPVLERIRADSKFVVATHESLDGDALGSLIAMHGVLRALGKDSLMFVADSEFPSRRIPPII